MSTAVRTRSWSEFHDSLFADFAVPRKWEIDVAGFLYERGYHVIDAADVLAHAQLHGSVECCPTLAFSDDDRDYVESKLPDRPAYEWARYDQYVWAAD